MKDLSKLSDEDLLKLAQQEEQKAPSVDLKQLSDDELLQLAAEEESMLSKVGKTAGKLAGGVGMGIAEAVNPLAIPHGIETLVRAPFETTPEGTPFYKQPIVALEQASKNSFTAPNRLDDVAVALRTAGRGLYNTVTGGDQKLTDIYDQERYGQEKVFDDTAFQIGKTSGELGTAIVSLGSAAKGGIVGLRELTPKVADKIMKLRGLKDIPIAEKLNVAGKKSLDIVDSGLEKLGLLERPQTYSKQAQELTKDLLGQVTPEVADAIFTRSDKVEQALNGGPQSRELFSDVKKLRDHIDATQENMGDLIEGYKTLIRSNTETSVPTRGYVQMLSKSRNGLKLESGQTVLKPGDAEVLAKYRAMLLGPKKVRELVKSDILEGGSFDEMLSLMTPQQKNATINMLLQDIPADKVINTKELSVSDVSKIIDSMDDDLKGFYKGNSDKVSGQVLSKLAQIRSELKGHLHNLVPGYGDADGLYKNYIETANSIRSKIDGLQGESFLANIFGQNKSEARELFTDLVNQGKLFSEAAKKIDSHPVGLTFKDLGEADKAVDLINKIRTNAEKAQFKPAQDFLNDIATKIAARQLHDSSVGTMRDVRADRIRELVQRYTNERVKKGEAIGATIGGLFSGSGSLGVGLFTGQSPGSLMTSLGLTSAGGAYTGSKIGGLLSAIGAEKKAEALYDPARIFDLIRKSKGMSEKAKSVADDFDFIRKTFGADSANKFLNMIPLTADVQKDIANTMLKVGIGGSGLSNTINFEEGSTITPRKK
jgi:hypothetical protein